MRMLQEHAACTHKLHACEADFFTFFDGINSLFGWCDNQEEDYKHCQLRTSKMSHRDTRVLLWTISNKNNPKIGCPENEVAIDINTITRDKYQ